MPNSALPPSLQNKPHWDWPWPFSLIPRGWTAFQWGEPTMILGNQARGAESGAPTPIGEPGSWQVAVYKDAPWWAKPVAWYAAFTLPGGRHVRLGARWDDVDNYVQWPTVASRVYPPEGERDTSTL